jgi:phosphoribosylglycinamide formyltransferase-1
LRLAVLLSGSGTNLRALLAAITADPGFGGEVVVVGSDRATAGGLAIAQDAGVPTVVEQLADHPDRPTWEAALVGGLQEHAPDGVVLAGFMKVVSPAFLAAWPGAVLNTHPSLLPAFRGARAVEDAVAHGVRVTGCTVHLVDELLDHGPIVAQRAVPVAAGDDAEAVAERIKQVEHELYPACVRALCRGELRVEGRRVLGGPA